jgi:cation-transporting P-type ATPase I
VPLIPRPFGDLFDRLTGRTRRVWSTEGRAHLEYRPPAPEDAPAFAARLVEELRAVDEVRAVTLNPFVQRVVVGYHDLWVTPEQLVAVIEGVEAEFGLADRPFPPDRPDHPGDLEPLQRELVQLASTALGIGTSVLGRLRVRRLAPWPTDLAWLATLVDNVPHLREGVEHRLGQRRADLVLGITTSILRGVSLGLSGHFVDVARRLTRLRQLTATRAAWTEREPSLTEVPAVTGRPERVAELPQGPIESYSAQAWSASLGGFAASALATDDVERAAAPLLDGIPKAARLGRAAFADQLARVLAERGTVVLDDRVLTLLDRVDVLALDGDLLEGLHADERDAFVRGVRGSGLEVVVSTGGDAPKGMAPVAPKDVDGTLAELQLEGHVVLGIGRSGSPVLPRADVRVGLQPDGDPPPWDADVLCGAELADALVLIRAAVAARRASRHAVTLATTGAGIGAATALGGLRRSSGRDVLRVVDTASLLSMGNGIRLASELATLPDSLHRDETPWHTLEVDAVLAELGSSVDGLSTDVWVERYAPPEPPPGPVRRVGRAAGAELANPLTPILAGGAAVSMATGSRADAGMVGGVIALNAAIGGAQRLKADRAVSFLTRDGAEDVTVRRDGREQRVPAAEVVVGDVLVLGTGEPIPADARLLEARALEVDESALTGESLPVVKQVEPVGDVPVADRASLLHQGTNVAAGEAVAVVVATGIDTESRRAIAWADEGDRPRTGVEARLEQLTKLTIPLAMMSGAGVSIGGLLRRSSTRELADASIGLAIAAVPEGLPLLANAAQRSAARRLSRHRVLVRDPRSIEALGRVDLLCADKTGTLTQGRLQLAVVSDGSRSAPIEDADEGQRRVLLAARRATPVDPTVERLPHPTDHAVAVGTEELGVQREDGGEFELLDDLPFEPGRSYHAVLADTEDGRWLSVKGSPEQVLGRCTHRLVLNGEEHDPEPLGEGELDELAEHADALAAQGLRVLAVAERSTDVEDVTDDHVAGLTFVGFVGMRDPVRPVSADSIARLREAGTDTIMITGDHPTTARAIAAELGLDDGAVLTGPELDELDDEQLAEALPKVTVFARVTPFHKVRIVRTAQELGRVVAMTGDGANDAPAIRLADVGIAVGERATAVAREAADVVILDDRLEVIVDAIAEGRGLWGSVREAVAVLVGGNLGEISFTLLGSVVGGRPPLNTRQLLLVNLLTDVAPAMALAVRAPRDSVEELLAEGPERSLGDDLSRALVWRGTGAAVGATFTYAAARLTGTHARARTAGLVALVGAQLGQTVSRSAGDPRVVLTGLGTFAAMTTAVQTPGVSRLVGSRPMGPVGWTFGMAGAAIGTAVGLVGPRIEPFLAGSEEGFSGRLIDQLAELAPDMPMLLDLPGGPS